MALGDFLFTSESVCAGHPDKVCDQISDAVLDACLAQDKSSRVAVETAISRHVVLLMGEMTTSANIDVVEIARSTLKKIGYVSEDIGVDADKIGVINHIIEQCPDIARAVDVHREDLHETTAGDQGIMFGYATSETPELMPLSHVLSNRLARELTRAREEAILPWSRPDGKTQVTLEYSYGDNNRLIVKRAHTILISIQHNPDVTVEQIRSDVTEHIVKKCIPESILDDETKIIINPSGRFVLGCSAADSGLTGRKIIVDTYGGWGAHGGGAFSGKDWTKVDRSGAYAARRAAKSLVRAGLCYRALVQLSYGIGLAEPLSITVQSYDTCIPGVTDSMLTDILRNNLSFTPDRIKEDLKLTDPKFSVLAVGGHMGREDWPGATWETVVDLSHCVPNKPVENH